jgi:hypothetical protein
MGLFSLLFGGQKRTAPGRLYVVIGDPHKPFSEPRYLTDPRHYGLQLFEKPVSDEEFARAYRHKVKAFIKRDDAITFAYHCNLANVMCPVYDKVDGKWICNTEETGKVADAIN